MTANRKRQHKTCCESESAGSFRNRRLKKLGLNLDKWDYVVALAGNPNTGKSTVFNSLTGLRQHTGNWPGKTVNRAEGGFNYQDKQFKLVDLPGTYSLLSASEDEEIARNFVLFGQPDVTVAVVDATRLQRNLNLLLQILEITGRVVVCLNVMDEAQRKGISIDVEKLEKKLGVPVVPASARYGEGLDDLLDAIAKVAQKNEEPQRFKNKNESAELKVALDKLQDDLDSLYPELPNTRWLALRLLDGDEHIIDALKSGELLQLVQRFQQQPIDLDQELEEINQELETKNV
jgi:ferrous iron transport protein B